MRQAGLGDFGYGHSVDVPLADEAVRTLASRCCCDRDALERPMSSFLSVIPLGELFSFEGDSSWRRMA